MKKLALTILLLITSCDLFAQNLDSLYNEFFSAVDGSFQPQISAESHNIKCALNHIHQLRENYDQLSLKQQNKISQFLSRPETELSAISPSGYFRIHYNPDGIHAPKYDLNELALALDSAYNFEVNKLGYLAPPEDNNEGGDNLYDVYIQDLGLIYGYTDFFLQDNSPSYIVIDNDFAVHFTKGIDGARVTAAHEFHHAIQVGHYKYRSEDSFFYEMLSTSMEEFVYDSINDYYDYIRAYYYNTTAPFYATSGGGYDLAIWNLFLQKKYGFDIIKKSLENLSGMNAMESIAYSIGSFGGSFKEDLSEFGIWNYFTDSRSKPGEYFEEARNYPKIKPMMTLNFDTNAKSVDMNSNPSSNTYLTFVDISRGLPDTLTTIITNSDYQSQSKSEFEYFLYNFAASNALKINDLYYSKLSALDKSIFVESVIFNNELASEGRTERKNIDYVYPQPFSYKKHNFLFLPCAADVSGKAILNIYTSGMDLVFSSEKDIFATDKIVVRWNGKNDAGEKLPTGIYIYVTKAGDTVKKGKLVIYND